MCHTCFSTVTPVHARDSHTFVRVSLLQNYEREQYEYIVKFSTPPTDAETLAFLRKYDLKPSEATRLYKTIMSLCESSVAGG